jgi:hypothetical protein
MTVKRKTSNGPDPELIARLQREGRMIVHDKPYAQAKEERERSGRKLKEKPAYLLPDDHFRKRKRVNTTLSTDAKAIAKKIGAGNISRGIEAALLHWFDCPRTDRRRRK